jgi:predicted NBD/HSP70 family sugar kinase
MQQQPARLARYNRAVVLDLIRRFGPISKSELAERSGLAISSVLNALASLSRRGLVRMVGLGPSTGGRPPTLVELNPQAHYAIGVNIRVTVVEAVLLDLVGDIVAETVLPLQGGLGVDAVIATVVEAVDQVVRLGHIDPGRVLGVGVGCPGPVRNGRVVVSAPALSGWRDVPLAEQLERRLGLPVTLENDANLGALAEYRHGVGRTRGQCDSLVYIYADHGIGAGVVIGGKVYRGVDGMAGELGHTVIDVDGPPCICGNYGCLETFASVSSIIRRTVVAAKLGETTSVGERSGGDWDAVSYEAISEAVEQGDAVAQQAVNQAVAYLAVGVANVIRQFSPQVIVLGGQLFDQTPYTAERLRTSLANRPVFYAPAPTTVLVGELGARAASVGAATLVLENFFGVPEQVMSFEPVARALEPAFERAPVWPLEAQDGALLAPSKTRVRWAGNLQPIFLRVRSGEPVTVTLDVLLEDGNADDETGLKVLLHWDRVALFGGNWPNPKNSPMHRVQAEGLKATYSVTLGALPPGKYEFVAHVLAANDMWVPGPREPNGRVEVLARRTRTYRAATARERGGQQRNQRKKEVDRAEANIIP